MNNSERQNQDVSTGAALGAPSLIGVMRDVESALNRTMGRLERATFASGFMESARQAERAAVVASNRASAEYRELGVRCTECGDEPASFGLCDQCSLLTQDVHGQTVGAYIDAMDDEAEQVKAEEGARELAEDAAASVSRAAGLAADFLATNLVDTEGAS